MVSEGCSPPWQGRHSNRQERCASLLLCSVIKITNKSNMGRKGIFPSYTSSPPSILEQSQGKSSGQEPWREATYWLTLWFLFSLLSYTQVHLPHDDITHNEFGPSHINQQSKQFLINLAIRPVWSGRSPSSDPFSCPWTVSGWQLTQAEGRKALHSTSVSDSRKRPGSGAGPWCLKCPPSHLVIHFLPWDFTSKRFLNLPQKAPPTGNQNIWVYERRFKFKA